MPLTIYFQWFRQKSLHKFQKFKGADTNDHPYHCQTLFWKKLKILPKKGEGDGGR
jgi:hypothetical protein